MSERIIKNLLKKIKTEYRPEMIILFGSSASGKIMPGSDVDICLVKKTKLRWHLRAKKVREIFLDNYLVPMDFIVYTPGEFNKFKKDKMSFLSEILNKGKVMYDAKSC
ncbi:MAG: nucleotidyltransferase domain-containing protein [Elusimicrobiota bacterium]|nr:nucleotidyltransferase domain-containing protein [Elusimicrobiota bacterium]